MYYDYNAEVVTLNVTDGYAYQQVRNAAFSNTMAALETKSVVPPLRRSSEVLPPLL